MMPETAARITRPITSSMTAAPRMIRDSLAPVFPRSRSTRAVMPTLVAHSVAPMKTWTSVLASGRNQALTHQPRSIGAMTPTVATTNEDQPTSSMSLMFDSRPTSNSRMMTPISASIAMASLVFK